MKEVKMERPKDISRVCRVMTSSRSSMAYSSVKNDITLMENLRQLAQGHPVDGFWKCYHRIRNAGRVVNHRRLHRVYKLMGLSLRRKTNKRLPARVKEPFNIPKAFTQTWNIDFMSDALSNGRKFRTFNVIDEYNHEILFIKTEYSLKSSMVIWVLNHLVQRFGNPTIIRMDNGPEFIAKLAQSWSQSKEIEIRYIQPGKPTQNAFKERFNKSIRQGVLNAYLYEDLEQVRDVTAEWIQDYNHHRKHDALGGISPVQYRQRNAVTIGWPIPLHSGFAFITH